MSASEPTNQLPPSPTHFRFILELLLQNFEYPLHLVTVKFTQPPLLSFSTVSAFWAPAVSVKVLNVGLLT